MTLTSWELVYLGMTLLIFLGPAFSAAFVPKLRKKQFFATECFAVGGSMAILFIIVDKLNDGRAFTLAQFCKWSVISLIVLAVFAGTIALVNRILDHTEFGRRRGASAS